MNNNCHVTYDLSPMASIKTILAEEVVEVGYSDRVAIDYLPSYVSGSLLLGAVSCQLDSLIHLHSTYTFDVGEYNDVDVIDAVKAASTYRLFGHDIDVVHFRTHETYPVYANVADATVATYELLGRTRDFDRMRLLSSKKRAGRTNDLPEAQALSTYGRVAVTIERPMLAVTAWQRRDQVLRPSVVLQSRRQPIEFRIGNTSQYRTAHFNVGRPQVKVQQGFHDRQPEVAPSLPIISGVSADIHIADHGDSEMHAETAG